MAKYYIRDARHTTTTSSCQEGGAPNYSVLIYHFLRTCGFDWIWECDGNAGDNPTHITDGNMEDSGVSSWADVGTPTTKAKVTTPLRQGTQALQISTDAVGEGAQSAGLVSTRASTQYHVTVWASNNSGNNFEVHAYDGVAGPSKLGDLPDNSGVYTAYHFDFTTGASGTPYIQILSTQATAQTIYIDGIIIFESYFEYAGLHNAGTDGSITNPDQFTSPSDYTFTAGDVGRWVCVYDPTNPTNTGAYEILSESSGTVTLELRSTTGTLTTQSGLAFRVIDIDDASVPWNINMDTWLRSVGWGLESPHSSGWRLFFRHSLINGQASKAVLVWAAPEDTDYDYETGTFISNGPSTQRGVDDPYEFSASSINQHNWMGGYSASTSNLQRFFLMMEDDFSFLTFIQFDTVTDNCGLMAVGYTGTDTYNTGIMEFDLMAKNSFSTSDALDWTSGTHAWARNGVSFLPNDQACSALLMQLGYGGVSLDVFADAGNVANPFSSEEWLVPVISQRYGYGENPEGSVKPWSKGVYQGRHNITNLTTFDSEQYIHFKKGLIWAWNGFDLT